MHKTRRWPCAASCLTSPYNRTIRRLFCFLCFNYNFLLDNNIHKVDTFHRRNFTKVYIHVWLAKLRWSYGTAGEYYQQALCNVVFVLLMWVGLFTSSSLRCVAAQYVSEETDALAGGGCSWQLTKSWSNDLPPGKPLLHVEPINSYPRCTQLCRLLPPTPTKRHFIIHRHMPSTISQWTDSDRSWLPSENHNVFCMCIC